MGLVAGHAQAAQGMSLLAFPFVFVSSAYVPVESMPGWMQPIAEHQPVTPMVGAVRALSSATTPRPCSATAPAGSPSGRCSGRSSSSPCSCPLATRTFARR